MTFLFLKYLSVPTCEFFFPSFVSGREGVGTEVLKRGWKSPVSERAYQYRERETKTRQEARHWVVT